MSQVEHNFNGLYKNINGVAFRTEVYAFVQVSPELIPVLLTLGPLSFNLENTLLPALVDEWEFKECSDTKLYMTQVRSSTRENPMFQGILTNVVDAQEWYNVCDRLRELSHWRDPIFSGAAFDELMAPGIEERTKENLSKRIEMFLLHTHYVLDRVFGSQANCFSMPKSDSTSCDWVQLFWSCLIKKQPYGFVVLQPALLCARYCYSRCNNTVFLKTPPNTVAQCPQVYIALRTMLCIGLCKANVPEMLWHVTGEFYGIFADSVTAIGAEYFMRQPQFKGDELMKGYIKIVLDL